MPASPPVTLLGTNWDSQTGPCSCASVSFPPAHPSWLQPLGLAPSSALHRFLQSLGSPEDHGLCCLDPKLTPFNFWSSLSPQPVPSQALPPSPAFPAAFLICGLFLPRAFPEALASLEHHALEIWTICLSPVWLMSSLPGDLLHLVSG